MEVERDSSNASQREEIMESDKKTSDINANSRSSALAPAHFTSGDKLLAFAAVIEGLTGLALIVNPEIVVRLLLGAELSGAGIAMGRVAGAALFALGLACRPSFDGGGGSAKLFAMLAYNLPAALYLIYLGIEGALVGILLWPAAALHVILTVSLVMMSFKRYRAGDSRSDTPVGW
jgi:hypothetical protein